MLIFWRLIFTHFLIDFTLQSNKLNEWKRQSFMGMAIHCLIHPVVYFLIAHSYINDVWLKIGPVPVYGYLAILLIFALHLAEDEWRVFSIRRSKERLDNTAYFLFDQLSHVAVLFVFSGFSNFESILIPEKWPLLGALAIGATHFSVVFLYFIEKDLFGRDFPKTQEKYLAITERALIFASLVFVPQFYLSLVLAALALFLPRTIIQKQFSRIPRFSWIAGGALSLFFGLLGRVVF